MGSLAQADDDQLFPDLDVAGRVDELAKQLGWARPAKAFQPLGQPAIEQVREHCQGQVEVYVQADVTAQAIEVKERDLLTKVVLYMIAACIGLNDIASGLPLRQVVGQEKSRRFLPQPCHD